MISPGWFIALLARCRPREDLGRKGEQLAAKYLASKGYRILGHNLQSAAGEADLLCEDPRTDGIVLVEVKSRRRPTLERGRFEPEQAVGLEKQARLLRIARALRRANGWNTRPIRIDIIAVDFGRRGSDPVIRHHVNAVSARPRN
ncbi:MAG: hypothetical protein Kow0022_17140 [Phycisphaerales bacterium]